jgi:hypothetical protein
MGDSGVMDDAIVLWGLLLLYGIPICAIAYWMEKMMSEKDKNEETLQERADRTNPYLLKKEAE